MSAIYLDQITPVRNNFSKFVHVLHNEHSMFKFLNFLHTDPLRITQQFGTVAKPPVPSSLNLSPPYACQKALTGKHRQSGLPVL